MPLVTGLWLFTCTALYLLQQTADFNMFNYTLNANLVVNRGEYYRLLTNAFFHASLFHILFNMLAATAVTLTLERKFGSLTVLFSILWGALLGSCLHVLFAVSADLLFSYGSLAREHSLGYSGVIFQLTLLETYNAAESHRALFGMVQVPVRAYPWALLCVIQILVPEASFIGHLSGLVVGALQLHSCLDLLFPSPSLFRRFESLVSSSPRLSPIINSPSSPYVPMPSQPPDSLSQRPDGQRRSPADLLRALRDAGALLLTASKNALLTAKFAVCGERNGEAMTTEATQRRSGGGGDEEQTRLLRQQHFV